MPTNTQSSNQLRATLGTRHGGWRHRLLMHHLPLAVASAVILVLFIGLSPFTTSDSRGDIASGPFPKAQTQGMAHGTGRGQPMDHDVNQAQPMNMPDGPGQTNGPTRSFIQQLTIATGYLAVGLLGLTLLIGTANLLLRKRNPVSNYLRRDLGAWVAIASVAHVVFGVRSYGVTFVDFFIDNGALRTNSFGLGNWTGLAALVIVVALLTISTDRSLRELKARPWKNLQRLNYALFALVVLHAFFYGALLRTTSPFTLVLIVTVATVFVGQAVGIWLWRRSHPRIAGRRDEHSRRPTQPTG